MDSDSESRSSSSKPDLGSRARWFFALAAVIISPTLFLFVDETEIAMTERFGRITAVYDQPAQSGLHFKLPWPIERIRRFDRRLQLLTPAGREAFTRDRKNVTVEAYLCWKIAEGKSSGLLDRPVVRFFQGLGSVEIAESRLTSRLQSILTEQIGRTELSELLKTENSESGPPEEQSPLERLSARIRQEFEKRSDEERSISERLGIEIVDIRIRRLNLPAGNMQAVFERMRSERQKIAERYRSAGLAENRMIRSQADRQSGELLARANADAERIRGEGEALAIHILNEAHSKDPEFASLLQTLESYQQILNDKTTLVLSGSSRFLKVLIDGIPARATAPALIPDPPSSPTPGDESEAKP